MTGDGRLVQVLDTRLFVEERGEGFPVVVLHGGPGLDHHEFGDYLDPLGDEFRLILVDQRSQGRSDLAAEHTWTIENMAEDVVHLAWALELDRYAVLGHSFGGFVALQNAVDFPGMATATIVSSGVPSARATSWRVERNLAKFEPVEHLRERVRASWDREPDARTTTGRESIVLEQLPFHFADPADPRIAEYEARTAGARYAPDVLRRFARVRLRRHRRRGPPGAGRSSPSWRWPGATTGRARSRGPRPSPRGFPRGELVVFERSAHMAFVEETEAYLAAVRSFLGRPCRRGGLS